MSKVFIEVTQSDIDGGVKGCNFQCPIACAVRRKCVAVSDVMVDRDSIWLAGSDESSVSHDQSSFIKDFDNERPVHPFTFELDVTGCEHYFKPESLS